MASLLAQKDQENLTYGHQTAAAAKPFNQGNRALASKTPGNKTAKTPFKLPLNDENGIEAAKTGLKKSKGNDDLFTGPKKTASNKNAFATPVAPKTRAPLGQKTTNAKAKPFQTPAALQLDNGLGKSKQNSVSARKPKLRVSHTEPVKVDVLGANVEEEPDIEYMPPRAKDLPDYPDDIDPNINLSMFENGAMRRDFFTHLNHHKGWDGLSRVEREQIRDKRALEKYEAEIEAHAAYTSESDYISCFHDPECPTQDCLEAPEIRRKARAKYDQKMADVAAHFESLPPIGLDYMKRQPVPKKQVNITKGPTFEASKRAASTLSIPKQKITVISKPPTKQSVTARLPSALVSRPKKPTQPTNPSSMRHSAAVAASNTTMGYSKGRAASASLNKARNSQSTGPTSTSNNAKPHPNTLAPEEFMKQYGEPRYLTDMWWKCRRQGLIRMPGDDEEKEEEEDCTRFLDPNGKSADDYAREEAEADFEIKLSF
ncbi:hypothetical protein MMC10_009936 [Thelotrema lepadinum]|nr:hypothetical protein [Thelotrema lepadinum]